MGIISRHYIKEFVCRYDKMVGVPYYETSSFPGLKEERYEFINKKGCKVIYFYFYYENYKKDQILLFLPGLSCGHSAYFREINELAKKGYKVLTLDYMGCGESEGKALLSLNTPTSDVLELLNILNIKEEILLVGHSLGGFTVINLMNLRNDFKRAVAISPFISIYNECSYFVKSKFILKGILRYEKKVYKDLPNLDNFAYLKSTSDKILFIHSEDDAMVPFPTSTKLVQELNNPNLSFKIFNNRKHNPNYTDDAVNYMNEVFGKYYSLIKDKKIITDEDKVNYFKDVSLERLTNQDNEIIDLIINHLK
jgi:pimeloyl-ACP methyl ester carboxylesterase